MLNVTTHSPFPGMDPYLEQYWGDVHHALCTYSRDLLRQSLPPGLIARMEERTIIEDDSEKRRTVIPDVRVIERGLGVAVAPELAVATIDEPLIIESADEPIIEGFVQILDTRSNNRVITVIEFISPTNKISKVGRKDYLDKQHNLPSGGVNLVEIDLIRAGPWVLRVPEEKIPARRRGIYHVCVSRALQQFRYEVYPIKLRDRLPNILIPLRQSDPDATLNLQSLIEQAYENGSYGYDVDYTQRPKPELEGEDADWAREMLANRVKK